MLAPIIPARVVGAAEALVLANFEEWWGFDAPGEGYQRAEEINEADLAQIALYGLDDGAALDALRLRYDDNDAALYRAHPELCPECGGCGCVETRTVVGTWANWNGPQLAVDAAPCPVCCGGVA